MKKNMILLFMAIGLMSQLPAYADDDFYEDDGAFLDYAIEDSAPMDITTAPVTMNDDAVGASVSTFDIAGIMLGMGFDDVYGQFVRGHALYTPRAHNSIIYTINPDWKYNLDYECRGQGVFVPSELEKCINGLARRRGLLYASELHLERTHTGETITVYFTSNATDNVVWRVMYNNDVDEMEGDAEKFENQRQKKILAFWQNVLDKYGAPNSGSDKWITTVNSYDPMMTAYYGALDLVDAGRNASDQAKNINDSRTNFKSKPYAF